MSFERMKKSFRSILGFEEQSIQQQSESKSQVVIENKFQKIHSREKKRIDVHQYAKQRLIEHYKKLIKQSDFYQLPVISFHQTQPKKVCENIEIARNPRWDRQSQSQEMLDSVTSRYIEPSESTNKLDFSKLLSNSKEEVKLDKKFSKCQKKSTMNLSQVEEQPIQKTEEKYISIQPITLQPIAQQVDTPKIETKKEEIQQIQQKHIIKNSVEKIIPKEIQKVQEIVKDQEVQKVQEIVKQEDIVQQKKQSPPTIIEPIIDQPKTTEQSNIEINPFTSTVSNPLFNAPWLTSNQPTIINPQIVQPQQQSFNLFQQDPIQQFQYPQQENVIFPFQQQQNTFNSQINTYPQQNLFNNSTNLFPQQQQQNLFSPQGQQQQQQNLFSNQGQQQQQNLFQIPQNYANQQTQNLFSNQQSQNLFPPQQNQIQNQQSNLFQINQDTFNQQQQQNLFSNQQNPFPNTQNQFQIFPQTQQQDNSFQFQTHSWGGGSFSANDQKQQLQSVNLFSAGADLFQQQENKTNQSQISADRYKNKMQKSNQQRLG